MVREWEAICWRDPRFLGLVFVLPPAVARFLGLVARFLGLVAWFLGLVAWFLGLVATPPPPPRPSQPSWPSTGLWKVKKRLFDLPSRDTTGALNTTSQQDDTKFENIVKLILFSRGEFSFWCFTLLRVEEMVQFHSQGCGSHWWCPHSPSKSRRREGGGRGRAGSPRRWAAPWGRCGAGRRTGQGRGGWPSGRGGSPSGHPCWTGTGQHSTGFGQRAPC